MKNQVASQVKRHFDIKVRSIVTQVKWHWDVTGDVRRRNLSDTLKSQLKYRFDVLDDYVSLQVKRYFSVTVKGTFWRHRGLLMPKMGLASQVTCRRDRDQLLGRSIVYFSHTSFKCVTNTTEAPTWDCLGVLCFFQLLLWCYLTPAANLVDTLIYFLTLE